jgi:hypothetical protein
MQSLKFSLNFTIAFSGPSLNDSKSFILASVSIKEMGSRTGEIHSLIVMAILSLLSILPLFTQGASSQEQQGVSYENPYFGITLQHPSNWEVESSNNDTSPPSEGMQKEIVKLVSKYGSDVKKVFDTSLTISVQNAESYLDTDTMQVKNASLDDYVRGKESEIASMAIPRDDFGLTVERIRDNQTTIDGNPAWKVESMTSFLGERQMYNVDILTMKDGYLYTLEFNTEPLLVPETLPIGQKMIDSFRITAPQTPISTPDAAEAVDSLSEPSPQIPPPEPMADEEGRENDEEDGENDEGE